MNPKMPKSSPSIENIWAGMIFSVVNMNVKYHSGFIPMGVGANGSAFWPISQGKKTHRTPIRARMSIQPRASFRMKLGKKGTSLTLSSAKPMGVLIPSIWTRKTWTPRNTTVNRGRMATWSQKKRERVAPDTSGPPSKKFLMGCPIKGMVPAISAPTRVADRESSFQGRRYPLKPKKRKIKRRKNPVIHVNSLGER